MQLNIPDYAAVGAPAVRSPLEILREAADQLGTKTGGLVTGSVLTRNPGGGTTFRYTFYLRVPRLDDYTDPLFYVWHDTDFYPASLMPAGGEQGKDDVSCHDPDEFVRELDKIFNSPDTKKRIAAMMELARHQPQTV